MKEVSKKQWRVLPLIGLLVALAFLATACQSAGVATLSPTQPATAAVQPTEVLPNTSATTAPTAAATAAATLAPTAAVVPEETFQADILILDQSFVPKDMTVPQGAIVTWRNRGQQPHSVVAEDGSFDSGAIQPGSTFQHTFDKLGTFNYKDSSGSLAGTITVVTAPTPEPTAAP